MQRQKAIDELVRVVSDAVRDQLDVKIQCCPNCFNFVQKDEVCRLVNQRPPARIIAFGCEKFFDADDIPF